MSKFDCFYLPFFFNLPLPPPNSPLFFHGIMFGFMFLLLFIITYTDSMVVDILVSGFYSINDRFVECGPSPSNWKSSFIS